MWHRISLAAILVVAILPLVFVAVPARADGGTGIVVTPLQPRPGDVITVKGDGLGANRTVEIRLTGAGGVAIDLGEVTTDAAGDVTADFRLPAGLAVGNYGVQARGAETVTTQITVRGAGAPPPEAMGQAPELRRRPIGQAAVLVAAFAAIAGLGILFARTADREVPA